MTDAVLAASRIVTPHGETAGTVTVRDGVIVAIEEHSTRPITHRLADDEVLLPGLVDSHVHVNEPGRTEWEGFASATRAAAAGGVTTIVDMPLNSIPATVDVAALEVKRAHALGQLSVDVAFWGGAIPGNAAQLRPLVEAGVVGFKCFLLPSGVEEFPPLDATGLAEAMKTIADFDGLLIAHAEDAEVIDSAPPPHGRGYDDFLRSRPPAAETTATQMLLEQVRRTGCRTHIVHVSAAESLPLIKAAKLEGLPVTAETCPHYLALTAERIPAGATQYKCCPPIRGAGNQDALWAGLQDGAIDMIVSDHSPSSPDRKHLDTGDFGAAWGGIASVQLGLPVVWTQARERGIPLGDVAAWMGRRPAELTRLAGRGTIAVGNRADFAVFAPDRRFVVDAAALHHRHPVTPYLGAELFGVVTQTWLAGAPIGPGELRGELVRP